MKTTLTEVQLITSIDINYHKCYYKTMPQPYDWQGKKDFSPETDASNDGIVRISNRAASLGTGLDNSELILLRTLNLSQEESEEELAPDLAVIEGNGEEDKPSFKDTFVGYSPILILATVATEEVIRRTF